MNPSGPIVLFDGVCNLCNASVRFILRHERDEQLRFAALQSEPASRLLKGSPEAASMDSVIVVVDGRVLTRSDAALEIAAHLRMPWRLLRLGKALPRAVRHGLYRFIAKHRYRFFGRQESCMVPDPSLAERFVKE